MSFKTLLLQSSVVAVPVTNKATDNGIISVLDLESYSMFGMSFGAIFQILTMFSVLLIILVNLSKLYRFNIKPLIASLSNSKEDPL